MFSPVSPLEGAVEHLRYLFSLRLVSSFLSRCRRGGVFLWGCGGPALCSSALTRMSGWSGLCLHEQTQKAAVIHFADREWEQIMRVGWFCSHCGTLRMSFLWFIAPVMCTLVWKVWGSWTLNSDYYQAFTWLCQTLHSDWFLWQSY